MHMADALLSPAVGATFWAGTLGTIVYCSKKVRDSMEDKMVPLMGVLGAFIFAAQMINFSIPGTGSSGHLGGGMILAILLGPHAAFLVMASVLTIQAFFFADGGLLALGSNIWNLGIYPCFVAYPLIYKPISGSWNNNKRTAIASILGGIAGLQLGALSVVIQTVLSGRSELPFTTFLFLMQLIHLAIGMIEGFVTAGVINFIRKVRPEILDAVSCTRPLPAAISLKKVLAGIMLAALLMGGALSWFASSDPDGLEWSVKKVIGRAELPGKTTGISPALKAIQEETALLPDYEMKGPQRSGSVIDRGKSVSGVVGSCIVLAAVLMIGFIIRAARKGTLQK